MRKAAFYSVIIILFGCAQQVAPTGGPQDQKPPEVLSELPLNRSTNFTENRIVISFDEFIQLKSPADQILISPPMAKLPSYALKKKSLVINFEEELAENTTYTINFGEAIRDNNEGNILPNYTYVFSTGAHLDSMQVKGKVVDAISSEPEKDVLVMLYKSDIDSLPQTSLPDYFTRSTSDGSFHIEHVGDRPYKIFALKDENANYKFDVPSEKIGFLDSLIYPFTTISNAVKDTTEIDSTKSLEKTGTPTIPSYEMSMFQEEDTTQFLKKAYCEHFGKLVFVYNRPVELFSTEIVGGSFKKEWFLKDFSVERDSVTLWITDVVPDTMSLLLNIGTGNIDTTELVMKPFSEDVEISSTSTGKGGRKKQLEKFTLQGKSDPRKGLAPKPEGPFSIIFNHPIIGTDLKRIKLYEDSQRVRFDIDTKDPALRRFDLRYPWKKDATYRVLVLDSAFTDIFGLWNDTLEFSFKGIDKNVFGDLILNLTENPTSDLLIELQNSNGSTIETKSVNAKGQTVFSRLNPGKYSIRVVTDVNSNGKWDSGWYSLKSQPEQIRTIQQGSEVRPNWSLELDWNPNESE